MGDQDFDDGPETSREKKVDMHVFEGPSTEKKRRSMCLVGLNREKNEDAGVFDKPRNKKEKEDPGI